MLLATYEVTSEKRGEPGDRRSIGSSGPPDSRSSLERRWSSRRFPYGYLVTTSPQSPTIPWAPASLRLAQRLLVQLAFVVWRAVCTRPGNVFSAACWSALT